MLGIHLYNCFFKSAFLHIRFDLLHINLEFSHNSFQNDILIGPTTSNECFNISISYEKPIIKELFNDKINKRTIL
jgi:hypothetical protein